MRSFDTRVVGGRECRAWETYYRHEWGAFLTASVGLVRAAFGMSWRRTLLGARLVRRANQVSAPYPDNDAEGWRVHREAQHAEESGTSEELTLALHDLYASPSPWTRPRCTALLPSGAEAMEVSDRWLQGGCDPLDPRPARDSALLARSYAS